MNGLISSILANVSPASRRPLGDAAENGGRAVELHRLAGARAPRC